MTEQTPTPPQQPVVIPRKVWEEMERFRKGETEGDVKLVPPPGQRPQK